MVEGKPSTCYDCDPKGYIKRMSPLNIQHELTGMEDRSEVASGHEDIKQREETTLENKDCYINECAEEEYTEVTKRRRERIDTPSNNVRDRMTHKTRKCTTDKER